MNGAGAEGRLSLVFPACRCQTVYMVDPALAALTLTALAVASSGLVCIGTSIWKGRCLAWMRGGAFGHFATVKRIADPVEFWLGLLLPLFLTVTSLFWALLLLSGLIEGKKLHSRFRDGTAVFDNEGVVCRGDPPGLPHFHSCSGPLVPVPE